MFCCKLIAILYGIYVNFVQVMEENQPNSTVGRIVAIDKDANQNGKVNYKIQWPNQYKQYNNLFILTEHGKLIATQSLDRERVPNGYKFTVSHVNCARLK